MSKPIDYTDWILMDDSEKWTRYVEARDRAMTYAVDLDNASTALSIKGFPNNGESIALRFERAYEFWKSRVGA